jgi:arylsulfatase A-like enzyme
VENFSKFAILLLSLSFVVTIQMLISTPPVPTPIKTGEPPSAAKSSANLPNIILITCESLAAGNMSLYGYERNTTPNLISLGKESYVFENMHANANSSASSLASILEGTYLNVHRRVHSGFFVAKNKINHPNLSDILRSFGYTTYAIDVPYVASSEYANSFSFVDPSPEQDKNFIKKISLRYNIPLSPYLTNVVNECFKPILKSFRVIFRKYIWFLQEPETEDTHLNGFLPRVEKTIIAARKPYFVWAFFNYLHHPYLPKSPYLGMFLDKNEFNTSEEQIMYTTYGKPDKKYGRIINKLKARYDEEMVFLDNQLGEFIKFLNENNIFNNCILIVTSDHGQAFSNGRVFHGGQQINEGVLHIPLIIHLPHQVKGARVKAMAEQVDITATILELIGSTKTAVMNGESLYQYMENPGMSSSKPKFSMVMTANKLTRVATFDAPFKLIYYANDKKSKLYNIIDDPSEMNDLSQGDAYRGRAEALKKLIIDTYFPQ